MCCRVSWEEYFCFGGLQWSFNNLSSAEVYDITTRQWTQLLQMKKKRSGCEATAIGNTIHIVGGKDQSNFHCSCEIFDTSTNTWSSSIPDMNQKRK